MSDVEVPVLSLTGEETRKIPLPPIFKTPVRLDLVKKAVLAVQSHSFQPQGRDPMAGKRTSAKSRGVGLGIARIPRVKGSGSPKSGQAGFAPGTVGGRVAHPPKTEKTIVRGINIKERKLGIRSAIAATAQKELVERRGHKVEMVASLPLVVEDKIEELKTTKSVADVLVALGLGRELERVARSRKIRGGKGKMRGRGVKLGKGPLLVVSEDRGVRRAASNLPGVEVAKVTGLNAELLAPGAHLGRLALWSESAMGKLSEGRLFE